jgi:hypothetical protein
MAGTEHVCPKHPDTPGAWVEGTVDRCPYHGLRAKPNMTAGLKRLIRDNRSGISSRDVERSVIQEAKREGRDLARPADYPHL